MGYWVDVIGFVLASDLLAASITGKFVSIGRGGGKATIPIKSFRLKLVLFLAACCLVGVGVWHLRSILLKLSELFAPFADNLSECRERFEKRANQRIACTTNLPRAARLPMNS